MLTPRALAMTAAAMTAFAGNSLLCRLALRSTSIDAATFTSVRLIAGAVALWLIVATRPPAAAGRGSIASASALFLYAAAFSYAYRALTAGTGALLLFGAVQVTMIAYGLWVGERLTGAQPLGFAAAIAGLLVLLLPGVAAPPIGAAALMLTAGIAWGVYSIRGKRAGDPTRVTTGNFLRAVPFALLLSLLQRDTISVDATGLVYAVISGALTSGVGYAIWYSALPSLSATTAATVQLSVPILATVGGIALLGEPLTSRFALAAAATLGGIALVVRSRPTTR